MTGRVKVYNLEVAEARGRVGCSEADLETFYEVRVLALRVGLDRHEHDVLNQSSQNNNLSS